MTGQQLLDALTALSKDQLSKPIEIYDGRDIIGISAVTAFETYTEITVEV